VKAPLSISSAFLVLVNLIPLWGVLHWGWDAGQILVLYWLENVVYGLINIPKILTANTYKNEETPASFNLFGRLFYVAFFIFHYGLFTLGHGIFVMEFTGNATVDESSLGAFFFGPFKTLFIDRAVWLTLGGLTLSHIISLLLNWFGRGEYKTKTPSQQMKAPYGRVFILHIVIIFGAALVIKAGSPLPALILLVVLKIVIDLISHWVSHAKKQEKLEQPA